MRSLLKKVDVGLLLVTPLFFLMAGLAFLLSSPMGWELVRSGAVYGVAVYFLYISKKEKEKGKKEKGSFKGAMAYVIILASLFLHSTWAILMAIVPLFAYVIVRKFKIQTYALTGAMVGIWICVFFGVITSQGAFADKVYALFYYDALVYANNHLMTVVLFALAAQLMSMQPIFLRWVEKFAPKNLSSREEKVVLEKEEKVERKQHEVKPRPLQKKGESFFQTDFRLAAVKAKIKKRLIKWMQ